MKAEHRDELYELLRARTDRPLELQGKDGQPAGRWEGGPNQALMSSELAGGVAAIEPESVAKEPVRKEFSRLRDLILGGQRRVSMNELGWLVRTLEQPSRGMNWSSSPQELNHLFIEPDSLGDLTLPEGLTRSVSGAVALKPQLLEVVRAAIQMPDAATRDLLRMLCRLPIEQGQRGLYWQLKQVFPAARSKRELMELLSIDQLHHTGLRSSLVRRIRNTPTELDHEPNPIHLVILEDEQGAMRLQQRFMTALEHLPDLRAHLELPFDEVWRSDPLKVIPPPWLDMEPTRTSPELAARPDPEEQHWLVPHLLENPNVVLQGPPGTGKTYAAEQLVKSLAGGEGPAPCSLTRLLSHSRAGGTVEGLLESGLLDEVPVVWEMVQMHPGYAYEDFVRGQVADGGGVGLRFVSRDRVLLDLARVAAQSESLRVVLVLDEINRCNLAAVLGELILVLEKSKRGREVRLQYGAPPQADGIVDRRRDALVLPPNLWLVGTMNTADRSIALVDYAIRRRFRFVDLPPDRDALRDYYDDGAKRVAALALFDIVSGLTDSPRLAVGHSYFMCEDDAWSRAMANRLLYEVMPLLREYHAERKLMQGTRSLEPFGLPLDGRVVYQPEAHVDGIVRWIDERRASVIEPGDDDADRTG
jgi:hypothetical protein